MARTADALVVGANGQDGRFLVRELVARGGCVVGIDRAVDAEEQHDGYRYQCLDVRDGAALSGLLAEVAPAQIFHVAAVHASSTGEPYETRFRDMLAVNVGSVHTVLEHLRRLGAGCLLYANSVKAFGEPYRGTIKEDSPRRSTCLYGLTKNAAHDLIVHYRRAHSVKGASAFMSNHESPLRPRGFFSTTVADGVSEILSQERDEPIALRSLDFFCDWGAAEEYAGLMVDAVSESPGRDFILASGRTEYARDVVHRLFERHDLPLSRWLIVSRDGERGRAADFLFDVSTLEELTGRRPERTAVDVFDAIVAARRGKP